MDIQKMMDMMSEQSQRERSRYQLTLGKLIEALKKADDTVSITPNIVGLGAYRGYYCDIALCIECGSCAFKTNRDFDDNSSNWQDWYKENERKIDFTNKPSELVKVLESLIGMYFDGYKGGYNQITLDTPLWLAKDYGDCSSTAIMDITDSLELVTKEID